MPAPAFAIRLPSARHPPNSFTLSPRYRDHDSDAERNLPISFEVIRDEVHCRWHLPLWLLVFGATVSILTFLFLLTGTVYPIPGWWTRYGSHSLDVLKIAGDIYRAGEPSFTINDSIAEPLGTVNYVEPRRLFARFTENGGVTTPYTTTMRRPSTGGPASLVDSTLSLLVQVRIPDTPRDARCTITSGITLARRPETVGNVARVHLWSLEQVISDASVSDEDYRPRREAHLSSIDIRPGEMPAQRRSSLYVHRLNRSTCLRFPARRVMPHVPWRYGKDYFELRSTYRRRAMAGRLSITSWFWF